ncbi:MAG: hypothetical protein O7H41_09500 [Planctomycetota bacterium]|nr:hypothetical protein [Planctomycetota bacterium]
MIARVGVFFALMAFVVGVAGVVVSCKEVDPGTKAPTEEPLTDHPGPRSEKSVPVPGSTVERAESEAPNEIANPRVPSDVKVTSFDPGEGLVLLSAGSNSGVEKGDAFGVFRDGKLVTKEVVEMVQQDWSGARITHQRKPLREGDAMKFVPGR